MREAYICVNKNMPCQLRILYTKCRRIISLFYLLSCPVLQLLHLFTLVFFIDLLCYNKLTHNKLKVAFNPIRSGVFEKVNDPWGRGGGGGKRIFKKTLYDHKNSCINCHHIMHVYFTMYFTHVVDKIFQISLF